MRITTGAPMPEGADTVVDQGKLPRRWRRVIMPATHAPGANVRRAGEDVRAGDQVLRAGQRAHAGARVARGLAGHASPEVSRKPTVAVFTTGDELVEPGMPLAPGQIHDSNRDLLMGLLRADGLEPTAWPRLPDDPAAVEIACATPASRFDLIITAAASPPAKRTICPTCCSARPHPFLEGEDEAGHAAALRRAGPGALLGLPGNPVSVLATYLTLGRALIDAMQGRPDPRPTWRARLVAPLDKPHPRREFVRGRLSSGDNGALHVEANGATGSHRLRAAADANVLIVVPEGAQRYAAGEVVEVVAVLARRRRIRTRDNRRMPIARSPPADALRRQQAGAMLVDVREAHERATGFATGAIGIARAELEATRGHRTEPGPRGPADLPVRRALDECRPGARAHGLHAPCFGRRRDVAWSAAGLPVTTPDTDTDFYDRYSRHLRLPEVGLAGQRRLEAARVSMVGAGGLGSPAAYYLAAAGVGTLVLADDDVVDRSNLQRQILHTDARIGVAKVESARIALSRAEPAPRIEAFPERVTAANVERFMADADVVIDGADNFAARYLLNDACVKFGKPLVYGAVHRFEGQVERVRRRPPSRRAPCYRCLFPEPPPPEAAPNCAEAGVLGVVPGVDRLVAGHRSDQVDARHRRAADGPPVALRCAGMRFRETRLAPDPDCPVCRAGA